MADGRKNRYAAWAGGRDPLTAPYDVRAAVDRLGDDLLHGSGLREALQNLLRTGLDQRSGLEALRERARELRNQAMKRGRLDGPLIRAQSLLDQALAQERDTLRQAPDDAASFAQAQLDGLPKSLSQAVKELSDYTWRSEEARATYQQILRQLREEVLGQRFAGLKKSLQNQDPQILERTRQMLADLNALLAQHAQGQDTTGSFAEFMKKHGELFPNNPQKTEELLDELAQQAAAGDRLMQSLSPEQQAELAQLMGQSMGPLAQEMGELSARIRGLRPQAFTGPAGQASSGEALSYGQAVAALDDLADLDSLLEQLSQNYPGSTLDDIDVDALSRQLGAGAVDDLDQLRQLDQELRRQNWLGGSRTDPTLSPKALRQLGSSALATVFQRLGGGRPGGHDLPRAGAAGERTGASRAWQFGDEQPLDVVRTLSNAVARTGRGPITLSVEDFEVVDTEHRSRAAIALCVDLSYSMISQGRWAPMKHTAIALAHLIATKFPQDALQIIGFGREAQTLTVSELVTAEPVDLQGTNLQHALRLAGQHLRRHNDAEPVVLVITDGEPTAHLVPGHGGVFNWPPLAETVQLTVIEVDQLTKFGATLNTFMLGDDPGLRRFVDAIARRSGGRVFTPELGDLGSYVIADYLRARNRR